MALMDIELPDGTVLEDIPEGTTKEQIYAKLEASGYDMSLLSLSKEKPKAGKVDESDKFLYPESRFVSPEVQQQRDKVGTSLVAEELAADPSNMYLQKELEDRNKKQVSSPLIPPMKAPSVADIASEGYAPKDIDEKYIAEAALLSSLIGGGYGKLASSGLGLVRGAITGGVEGAVGALAGEAARANYGNDPYTDLIAMGAEAAGGGAPRVAGEVIGAVAPVIDKVVPPVLKWFAPSAQTVATVTGGAGEQVARNVAFGKQAPTAAKEFNTYRNKASQSAVEDLNTNFGIKLKPDEDPAKFARQSIHDTLANNRLLSSADIRGSLSRINDLVKAGALQKAEAVKINNYIRSQSAKDRDPKKFADGLENLIKEGQASKDTGVSTAYDVLREGYDNFLAANNKSKLTYSKLKSIEEQQFIGEGRDAIYGLSQKGFTGKVNDVKAKQHMANIAKSPEAQKELRVAMYSYFKELPADQMAKKWQDVVGTLRRTKAMPLDEIAKLDRAIKEISGKTATGKIKDSSSLILREAIMSGLLPAEFANANRKREEAKKKQQEELVFSL